MSIRQPALGVEDIRELGEGQHGDGDVIWTNSIIGVPASKFVHPKEAMSVFWEDRGWYIYAPDRHDLHEQ